LKLQNYDLSLLYRETSEDSDEDKIEVVQDEEIKEVFI
jgi:hypothetical protein